MTLLVAVGNPLRGDDGVAHRVLELLPEAQQVLQMSRHQLTPEMAEDVAAASEVYFIDADAAATEAAIEPLAPAAGTAYAPAHIFAPSRLVALAIDLYGWKGRAFLCRTPAVDFSPGMRLSALAEAGARAAAALLNRRIFEKN